MLHLIPSARSYALRLCLFIAQLVAAGLTLAAHGALTAPSALAASAPAQPTLVFEAHSGTVIYAEDADLLWHPASLTKLMTAYLTFEAIAQQRLHLTTELTPSQHARWQPPVKIGLREGRKLTVDLALQALIARSANDIAVMLAEASGGLLSRLTKGGACIIDHRDVVPGRLFSGGPAGVETEARLLDGHWQWPIPKLMYGAPWERAEARLHRRCRYHAFIARMNDTAKRLGMTRTVFANANGLPDKSQVTSARDMALLTQAIIHDYPQYAEYFAQADVKIGKRELNSYNGLLRTLPGADGMKTGFICASGYNVVASATREGTRLVAVVMGSSSSAKRNERSAKLLELGFQLHGWKVLTNAPALDTLAPPEPSNASPGDITNRVSACVYGSRKSRSKKRRKK